MSSSSMVSIMSLTHSGSSTIAIMTRSVPTNQLWSTSKPNHAPAMIQRPWARHDSQCFSRFAQSTRSSEGVMRSFASAHESRSTTWNSRNSGTEARCFQVRWVTPHGVV